jgi:hypothetical protein
MLELNARIETRLGEVDSRIDGVLARSLRALNTRTEGR